MFRGGDSIFKELVYGLIPADKIVAQLTPEEKESLEGVRLSESIKQNDDGSITLVMADHLELSVDSIYQAGCVSVHMSSNESVLNFITQLGNLVGTGSIRVNHEEDEIGQYLSIKGLQGEIEKIQEGLSKVREELTQTSRIEDLSDPKTLVEFVQEHGDKHIKGLTLFKAIMAIKNGTLEDRVLTCRLKDILDFICHLCNMAFCLDAPSRGHFAIVLHPRIGFPIQIHGVRMEDLLRSI